jgi:hypothetical protein
MRERRITDLPIGGTMIVPSHAVCQDVDRGDWFLYTRAASTPPAQNTLFIERVSTNKFKVLVPPQYTPIALDPPFNRTDTTDVRQLTQQSDTRWLSR